MTTYAEFKEMFSFPRTPRTALAPGQYFDIEIPAGKRAIITDLYIDNQGGGTTWLVIMQQTGTNNYEIRYQFRTAEDEITIINFTTGLRLGDESPIEGCIRIANAEFSETSMLARVNGVIVG